MLSQRRGFAAESLQVFFKFRVTAGAAVAGPGVLRQVAHRPQFEASDHLNHLGLADIQAAADDFRGTTVAGVRSKREGHGPIPRQEARAAY